MSRSDEAKLQRATAAYVVTGLFFMLLPGTFLGVWNLIAISSRHSLASLSAAWLQAHGHAQIFGWIGTFVIGIGYYSLSKMGHLAPFAVSRAWLSWGLWTAGLILRWIANVYLAQWRILLPCSAALELAAFLIFFATVSRHESGSPRKHVEHWMRLVIASMFGFLLLLIVNLGASIYLALQASAPDFPHWFDQRYLVLATWGFPVLAVWGFNARWLPVFLGLPKPSNPGLLAALAFCASGVLAALAGSFRLASGLLLIASATAIFALHVFEQARQPAKTQAIHPSFPFFVRLCYGWLLVTPALSIWAAMADSQGGIWGASRHALTVGFLAGMIFAIGQRVLPAFCGMKVLFSPRLMLAASLSLNLGCLLRVCSEIPAYEYNWSPAWHALPCSAILELIGVSLFAANLALTLASPAPHLKKLQPAAA
ncbi:MAG TPA: NnrS family protein [Bryobacteraceae bacterium]|nr:NnrS family protein [Bryobacteraceae bacterium]